MRKLAAVEEAKSLFNEAKEWGMFQWLGGKKRARTTADAAWAALDEYEQKVKDGWSDDLKKAYGGGRNIDPALKESVKRLKEAEEEAARVHQEAEDIFSEADRRMSTRMACEGAQRALEAWEMRESVIRKLEAANRRT
jgi:hypothetical protein